MRASLFITVAAAAFSAVLAANNVFAQDEVIPKRQQPQQGEAPAMQQAPANKEPVPKHQQRQQEETPATQQGPLNKTEPPSKKPVQSQQEPDAGQPRKKPIQQSGEPAEKPAGNAEQASPAGRKQTDRAKCSSGQDANCQPSKSPKTGQEQPQTGAKPKTNLGQQQPEGQPSQQKKHPAVEGGAQPSDDGTSSPAPGMKPSQQTGGTQPGGRGDVDVIGNLNVPKEKASRVRDMLFRSGERDSVDVDVSVDVGRALPARVRPRPLPPDIVEIVPEYRSYDYVVVRDEIVIVEPRSSKVVEVIRRGGGASHAQAASTIRLTAEQRQMIIDYVRQRNVARAEGSFGAETGMNVPGDIELAPMPDTIVTEVPAVRSYDFFVDQNEDVVLVNPDSRAVVDVIQQN